jgi:hypothetical protein
LEQVIIDNFNQSNDDIAVQQFKSTVKFENGRYEVKWPWLEEHFDLPENRQLPLGR